MRRMRLLWGLVVLASVLCGWLFAQLHVPAAWIVAGIVVSAIAAMSTGQELTLNKHFFSFCRGIIGVIAGLPLLSVDPHRLTHFLLPGLFSAIVSLSIGLIGGILVAKAQPSISTETGILSMLAGGASMIPLLAKELGADYRYVALTQYLRLLAVSMSLPVVAHFLLADTHAHHATDPRPTPWWIVGIILACALLGEPLGRRLRIPVPSIFGPLILVVIFGAMFSDYAFRIPTPLTYASFLAIGWMCGGGLSVAALRHFGTQLPATLSFVAILIGGCALTAWPLTVWLDISYFEAYLSTSPGALETVLALSAEGNAGPAVVTIQLVRILCVLLLAAYLGKIIRLLRKLRG